MASRGTKPDPTRNRGEAVASAQPVPPDKPVVMPHGLSPEGERAWKHVAPMLQEAGVLSVMDVSVLQKYCEMQAQYDHALKFIQDHGVKLINMQGNEVLRPEWSVCLNAHDRIVRIETEYGMTPASRTRIKIANGKVKKNNAFGEIRKGQRGGGRRRGMETFEETDT